MAISFIDCINRGDIERLGELMTDNHALRVFDEPPLVGRKANIGAWRGYSAGFPDYAIHPHRIAENDGTVAVLGHTTGSHLGLPDMEESRLTLIWIAEIADGALHSWTLIEDNLDNRREAGLDV